MKKDKDYLIQLEEIRQISRLTQEDLGVLLGVSRRAILRWEWSDNTPRKKQQEKIFYLWLHKKNIKWDKIQKDLENGFLKKLEFDPFPTFYRFVRKGAYRANKKKRKKTHSIFY